MHRSIIFLPVFLSLTVDIDLVFSRLVGPVDVSEQDDALGPMPWAYFWKSESRNTTLPPVLLPNGDTLGPMHQPSVKMSVKLLHGTLVASQFVW